MPTMSLDELDPTRWTRGPVADLFSSYVAASALSAAHELGLLDALADAGSAPFGNGGDERLDDRVVRSICTALAWARVVTVKDDTTVLPGPRFDEAYAARGYFYWLVRGCGEVFATAPELARTERRSGPDFYRRDMRAVAIGSRLIGDPRVERLFDAAFADAPAGTVADLGCGSAQRLIRIVRNHPGTRGVGVDISAGSVGLAVESVAAAGLDREITIRQADVLDLRPSPEFAAVDTVTCVFMGHDFWPYERCVSTLRRIRAAFPAVRRFLLCDVVRTTGLPGPDTTIFTLGFESVHALMGVYLPTLDEWHRAFAEGGWRCDSAQPVDAPPNGHLFHLVPATD